MKFIASLLIFSSLSYSLTVGDVLRHQASSNFPDTAEIRMHMTVAITDNVTQTMEMKILQKGPDKSFSEMKSSLINIRTVQNGTRTVVEDLKTGKKQLSPEIVDASQSINVTKQLGDSTDYEAPVVDGILWRLEPKTSGKPTLFYDAAQGRIVEMQLTFPTGQTSVTKIDYAPNTAIQLVPGTPSKITMVTTSAGIQTTVNLQVLLSVKRSDILDAVFNVAIP